MSEIRNLTRNGETFYPLTHVEGVINRDGEPLGIVNDIFDISEYNSSGTPPTLATYTSLDLALAAVPQSKQKGGMTIRYVQSSDNKYVQFRLKKNTWSSFAYDWVNIKEMLDQRTNLFDEKLANLGWLYAINSSGQISKHYNVSYGQTAPIRVVPGEIISIYNATKNTDAYNLVRLASNDVEDVIDGIRVIPSSSFDGGSYYEYVVPPRTEYISVAYINNRDLWVYVNLREEVQGLQNDYSVLRNETVTTNLFDKKAAYYGWLYSRVDGQIQKVYRSNFGQVAPIKVNPGDILSIYNVTPNTDTYSLSMLGSDDIEDVTELTSIRPFKSIDGGSFFRYVVPSNVFWVSPGFLVNRADDIKIYKSIKIGNNPFVEINALGDSITQGSISSGTWANPTWCQIVANNLGCTVNNYGISATSICDGSSESFLARLNRMTEAWIDCLVIFGGTNDYGDKRAQTLGTINDEPAQGTNFYASFKNLVLTAIQKYPMAQILVITPMRRQNGSPNQYGISIEDIVNAEVEVAGYYGVECFDFYHNGGINPAITEQRIAYTSDGLHPNQLGVNRFLAPRFTMEIQRLITNRG